MKEVNGFKIIKDLGKREDSTHYYAIVICKACKMEFETSLYTLNRIKSCGCLPSRLLKELDREINGFKIIKDLGYLNGSRRAICICKVCNGKYEVDPNKLKYRKHCGCIKHGKRVCPYSKSHPRLMQSYQHMKARCYNTNNKDYYNYGARGIIICNEWKESPEIFCEWSLNNGYSDNLTIDRINSNGNYEPDNCRWVDSKTQARNTRRNVLTLSIADQIRIDKIKFGLTHDQLANKYGVSYGTVWNVLNDFSWTE